MPEKSDNRKGFPGPAYIASEQLTETRMDTKRAIGLLLTVLGIVGIIWGAWAMLNRSAGGSWSQSIIILVVAGVFFAAGISLVRTLPSSGPGRGTQL